MELKEKYTTAYNNKTSELKKVAYYAEYVQALRSINSDFLQVLIIMKK